MNLFNSLTIKGAAGHATHSRKVPDFGFLKAFLNCYKGNSVPGVGCCIFPLDFQYFSACIVSFLKILV